MSFLNSLSKIASAVELRLLVGLVSSIPAPDEDDIDLLSVLPTLKPVTVEVRSPWNIVTENTMKTDKLLVLK